MSKINHQIKPQAFELIRNRIGEILIDELDNQAQLSYDTDLEFEVWVERTTPFDKADLPVLNVSLSGGTYGNKNQGSVDGTYNFNIDGYTNSKTKGDASGDKLAAFKLHKILGVCRAILEDPIYKTLGYKTPIISRVYCSDIKIAERQNTEDAVSTMMGRLVFTVVANEKTNFITAEMIAGYETTIKLSESDDGFFYKGGS